MLSRAHQGQAGSYGPVRVVVPHARDAEQDHRGVSDELLHPAPIAAHRLRHRVEVGRLDAGDVLMVEGLREGRKSHQVGEQDGDGPGSLPGTSGRSTRQRGGSRSWRSGMRAVGNTSSRPGTLHPMHASPVSVSLITVATAGPSSEAAYVNRQSERAKPFKTTATAHSQAGEAQRSPPPDLGPPPWLRAST